MTSVLTFILLVVLVGGIGLLVVSLAESSKPTADGRGTRRADDAPPPPADADEEPEPEPEAELEPEPDLAPEPELEPEPAPELLVTAGAPSAPGARWPGAGDEPLRRRRPGEAVPRSQVAIEGSFADVARVPVWRRVLAVVGILAITVTTGVLVAAVLAALFGTVAELLTTTIG